MPKQSKKDKKTTKRTTRRPKKTSSKSCGCLVETMKKASPEVKLSYVLILILFVLMLLSYLSNSMLTKRWINKNPEVILESVKKHVTAQQEKMMKERQEMAGKVIKEKKKELYNTKYSGVANPKGKITIVQFFDYNCGYCKHVSKTVDEFISKNRKVRVIFKELPIMGNESRYAAKVATAVVMVAPHKYLDFHNALMAGNARQSADIEQAVKKAGIRFSVIEKVLKEKRREIERVLDKNLELAGSIGINGTPAFIVNGELVPGAINYETLKNLVEKAK